MTQGNIANVYQVRKDLNNGVAQHAADPTGTAGSDPSTAPLTPRQKMLAYLWSYYTCTNYDSRQISWAGDKATGHLERESIASLQYLPPGFYDAGAAMAPVSMRRPTAPYYLARAVVDRFSSFLFSKQRHPRVTCPDDPKTEDWLNGVIEATMLWSRFKMARRYGGGMGSSAMSFTFKNGRPVIEVHDPRWVSPLFSDPVTRELRGLEIRYPYKDVMQDPLSGDNIEGWFWYRRVIDRLDDTTWARVPILENEEPRWKNYESVSTRHGFGFCPAVWIQNKQSDELDGEPDCHGIYDIIQTVDGLYAQANMGTLANCDPTLHIATDADLPEGGLLKGSENAIQTEASGKASYLEITGAGIEIALKLAAIFEKKALCVARCVLDDNFDGPARTEEETEQNYANMLEQVDDFREQYGELGVKPLLQLILKAARKLGVPAAVRDSEEAPLRMVRQAVKLPRSGDGKEREIGAGEIIELKWPDFHPPNVKQVLAAVQSAKLAKEGGIIDDETATRYVAQYFHIEDVRAVRFAAREAQREAAQAYLEDFATKSQGREMAKAAMPGNKPDKE